ncbi:MAG: hypothetical protein M3R61_01455 [Chloroflexota bacterium]|nr:hypothetical protein [Chloroflexota bacterium]
MKQLFMLLLALPLLSVAPVPAAQPAVYWTRIAVQTSALRPELVEGPLVQACTWETAPARLQQQIDDPIGYPFGFVQAFSCAGDSAAAVAELADRAAAMQAEAAAYRQAHPIGGVR